MDQIVSQGSSLKNVEILLETNHQHGKSFFQRYGAAKVHYSH